MAQNTGSVSTSNGNQRSIRLTGTVSGGTVTWTVEIYSKFALSWSGSSLSWSGAASGSQSVSYSGTGAWITVKTFTTSISANSSQTLSVTWSQPAVSSTPATTVSTSVTVSRPALAPSAPSGLTASRSSDSRVNLSWSSNSTSEAPYSGIQVGRQTDAGGFVLIASLGAVTSFADTSVSAGHRFDYQVRATGPGGQSGWHRISYQSDVSLTPIQMTGATAAKNAAGGIDTSASYGGYSWGVTFDVAESTDGGSTWTTRATGLSSPSWTHTNPDSSVPHAYRWRAVANEPGASSPDPTLYGPWSAASATVQLLAPPNPPSSLDPNGAVFDGSTARTFSWKHNPVDTTAQTGYLLRYRASGASGWTTVDGTTASSRTFPAGTFANGSTWEWQVRTKGQHADWSDWSALATFTTSAAPTVMISSPADGDVLTGSVLSVTWAYYDSEGTAQSAWRAELLLDGVVVETLSGSGTTSSATFTTRLPDGSAPSARVTVRDGSGLWSAADTATYSVSYSQPLAPSVSAEWDREQGAVAVTVETPPGRTYSWEGTPNASASIETTGGVETRRNLIQNPDGGPSGSLAGWALVVGSQGGTGFTQTYETLVPVVDPPGVHVSKMRRQTWTAVSATTRASDIGYRLYVNARPPVIPGLVLGFEWWWRPSWEPVSDTSRMELRWYDAAGAQVGATVVVGLPVATAGVWQRIRHVSPVPAGAAQVTVGHSLSVPAGVIQIGDHIAAAGAIVITAATEAEALAQLDAGFFSGDTPDTAAAVSADVARSIDGGTTWETVAEGIDPNTTILDRTAPLVPLQYRAVAWSAIPSSAVGEAVEVPYVHDNCLIFVSGGDGYAQVCRVHGHRVTETMQDEFESEHWDGRSKAVGYWGEAEDYTVGLTATLLDGASTPTEWRDLLRTKRPVLYRDCAGRTVYGHLSVGISHSDASVLSLSVEELEADE